MGSQGELGSKRRATTKKRREVVGQGKGEKHWPAPTTCARVSAVDAGWGKKPIKKFNLTREKDR